MATLGLEHANSIISAALRRARELGLKPLAIVVVDTSGHLIAAQREDGASMFRFEIALAKAWGAAAMGVPSRALAERAASNPNFFTALAATAHGKLLPQPGAVLIHNSAGELVGAVGASGARGHEDEAVCAYGVRAAGFLLDPST